jgi:hypothetical protein
LNPAPNQIPQLQNLLHAINALLWILNWISTKIMMTANIFIWMAQIFVHPSIEGCVQVYFAFLPRQPDDDRRPHFLKPVPILELSKAEMWDDMKITYRSDGFPNFAQTSLYPQESNDLGVYSILYLFFFLFLRKNLLDTFLNPLLLIHKRFVIH